MSARIGSRARGSRAKRSVVESEKVLPEESKCLQNRYEDIPGRRPRGRNFERDEELHLLDIVFSEAGQSVLKCKSPSSLQEKWEILAARHSKPFGATSGRCDDQISYSRGASQLQRKCTKMINAYRDWRNSLSRNLNGTTTDPYHTPRIHWFARYEELVEQRVLALAAQKRLRQAKHNRVPGEGSSVDGMTASPPIESRPGSPASGPSMPKSRRRNGTNRFSQQPVMPDPSLAPSTLASQHTDESENESENEIELSDLGDESALQHARLHPTLIVGPHRPVTLRASSAKRQRINGLATEIPDQNDASSSLDSVVDRGNRMLAQFLADREAQMEEFASLAAQREERRVAISIAAQEKAEERAEQRQEARIKRAETFHIEAEERLARRAEEYRIAAETRADQREERREMAHFKLMQLMQTTLVQLATERDSM